MNTLDAAQPAIITTYRGPTDTRGARIIAAGSGEPSRVRITMPYRHELSATENHRAAAVEFVQRRHGGPWAALVSADVAAGRMAHLIMPDPS